MITPPLTRAARRPAGLRAYSIMEAMAALAILATGTLVLAKASNAVRESRRVAALRVEGVRLAELRLTELQAGVGEPTPADAGWTLRLTPSPEEHTLPPGWAAAEVAAEHRLGERRVRVGLTGPIPANMFEPEEDR